MFEKDTAEGFGKTSRTLAWLTFLTFLISFLVSVSWPLMDFTQQRSDLRLWHMNLGLVALLFVTLRLIWWTQNPIVPDAPKGLPDGAYRFSRLLVLVYYIHIFGTGIFGILNAWSMQYPVEFAGLFPMPQYEDGPSTAFSGYAHSVFLFYHVPFLILLYPITFIYQAVRYGVGIRRMFPGKQV